MVMAIICGYCDFGGFLLFFFYLLKNSIILAVIKEKNATLSKGTVKKLYVYLEIHAPVVKNTLYIFKKKKTVLLTTKHLEHFYC